MQAAADALDSILFYGSIALLSIAGSSLGCALVILELIPHLEAVTR